MACSCRLDSSIRARTRRTASSGTTPASGIGSPGSGGAPSWSRRPSAWWTSASPCSPASLAIIGSAISYLCSPKTLRETMMAAWRKDRPTLSSERPDGEKNTFLVRWQFGLAGIAAEAEDANWAERLTEQEAALACRYAPIELNGFPSWLESLAVEHPAVVDRVLGEELSFSLREATDANAYSK